MATRHENRPALSLSHRFARRYLRLPVNTLLCAQRMNEPMGISACRASKLTFAANGAQGRAPLPPFFNLTPCCNDLGLNVEDMMKLERGLASVLSSAVLVAVWAAAFVFGFPTSFDAAAQPQQSEYVEGCADLQFVGVRGSGQTAYHHRDFSDTPEILQVYQGLISIVPDANPTIDPFQLDYEALGTETMIEGLERKRDVVLKQRTLRTNISRYLGSVRGGVRSLTRHVQDRIRYCDSYGKKPKFVFAGYSQGAMVVHQYLRNLEASRSPILKNRVFGVALIADPQRVYNTRALSMGTAPISNFGVCLTLEREFAFRCLSPTPTRDIPARIEDRTWSLCYADDIVCDTTALFRINTREGFVTAAKAGVAVHTSYATFNRETQLIGKSFGRWAVNQLSH